MIPAEGHEAASADPHGPVHAYGRERVTAGMRGTPNVLPAGCAAGMGAGDAVAALRTGHRWRAFGSRDGSGLD